MSSIIAGIIALLMVAGGILPNYTNNKVEDVLKLSLNNPEKVDVKVYSTPSFKSLAGHYDRVEINVTKPTFAGIKFDYMKIISSQINLDYQNTGNFGFIKNGNFDTVLVMSPDNLVKSLDLPSITVKINNLLSNVEIPIPMLSGKVSIDNLDITFENNKPSIKGNFIALGGLISAPFSLTGELRVNDNNKIELYKPQITLMDEPLVMEEIQDLVKYINPIFDIDILSNKNMKIKLKRLYFRDNKLKLIGMVNINN